MPARHRRSHPRRTRRLAAAAIVVLGALALTALPAGAHVEIDGEHLVGGAPSQLRLHVPNERDDAATVRVELRFPGGEPWSAVSAAPTAGWSATATSQGIAWEGGRLAGSAELELPFTATLPAAGGELVVPVLQTYDDGEVVRWIDTPSGAGEPEHPAPVLSVAPGTEPATTTSASTAPASTTAAPTATTTTSPAGGDDSGPNPVVIVVAVVVLAGLAAGTAFLARRRSGR